MFVVETIAKIRRAHYVQGKKIKAICRELKVSRKVVRKVLRSDETAFSYERSVQPMPRLGAFKPELDRMLAANDARSVRERLTLIRLFEELRGLGYEGGYDAVRRYARGWQREQRSLAAAAFVPLSFDPGEAYQFDWSHEIVLINGTTVTVKVAHVRLDHAAHISTRQYARLVDEWVTGIGLRCEDYGTHSLRRTKASIIYKATGNLRAVQILLGHTKIESTVRYLGVDVEDALTLAEGTEV